MYSVTEFAPDVTLVVKLVYMKRWAKQKGFTIVELLIVIVVIAILVAIVIVAYNGVQRRAAEAKRESDLSTYYKAILAARENTGRTLGQITNSYWSMGQCTSATYNTALTEPRDLPKTHGCWTHYYDNLQRIGDAAGMNLAALRGGDARGNPYLLDENEGENGNCGMDSMYYLTGTGVASTGYRQIPRVSCTP